MGQKTHPRGFRLGIVAPWKSRWYAPKAAYGNFLVEDQQIRKVIDGKLNRQPPFAAVSDIMIERTREEVTITIRTARPGLVIGPKGAEVDKLREHLEDMIKRMRPAGGSAASTRRAGRCRWASRRAGCRPTG